MGEQAEKESKAVNINTALYRLINLAEKIESLQSEIRGDIEHKNPKPSLPENDLPSLAIILDETPRMIHEQCDIIEKTLKSIHSMLF